MSLLPLGGIIGSAAGVPLSQTAGSEAERAQRDAGVQQRQVDATDRSEKAAGIGTTEEDQETSERDADGRRLWETPPEKKERAANDATAASPPRLSKDATGLSGNQLDLTG
ncbi:MAG TPA: hypothetical protein VGM76_03435 [Lacipirellulaceae bacterium]